MRRLLFYTGLILLLGMIWLVLIEQVTWIQLLVGLSLGLAAVLVTDRILLIDCYACISRFNPFVLFYFVLYVTGQIYLSGLQMIRQILTGRMQVGLVGIRTDLPDDFAVAVLANAISLTPGTVTVERSGSHLTILWIDCVTTDPEQAGRLIKKQMEQILQRGLLTDPRRGGKP
jgi:multicomponent Na+:H+ antiporter subunit E